MIGKYSIKLILNNLVLYYKFTNIIYCNILSKSIVAGRVKVVLVNTKPVLPTIKFPNCATKYAIVTY